MQAVDTLNRQFAIPGAVSFQRGKGDLTFVELRSAGSVVNITTHGAHVTSWQPPEGEEVLFVSDESAFEPGSPIRGGVPVCFPWFGQNTTTPNAPQHGFARIHEWNVESVSIDGTGRVVVTFLLTADKSARQWWPYDFELRHTVTVDAALTLALETRNTGGEAFTFSEALHTYLRVSDVRNVSVTGLEDAEYISKTDNFSRKRAGREPLRVEAEIDRCYINTRSAISLDDPGFGRRLTVEKSGSDSTVVWNPWTRKAAATADFGDEEWPFMLCIETANAFTDAVAVAPGETHAMGASISVEQTG